MQSAAAFVDRVFRNGLLRNLGWFGLAEVTARVSRIFATVLIARALDAREFGVAAIALTAFELIRVVPNTGVAQAVIRAPSDRLKETCATAYHIAWGLCICSAAVQVAIGAGLALSVNRDAGLMLAVLAGVYLFMAPAMVNSYLVMRAERFQTVARIAAAQIVADNALAVVLALTGFGAWSLVLPKLAVAPIWMVGMRRAHSIRYGRDTRGVPFGPLLRFSLPILGTELLSAARFNLDNVLVGAILGVESLGLYYFVFNAGVGLSLSLTNALKSVLFPHLAEAVRDGPNVWQRFDSALGSVVLPSSLLILLQAAASMFYVPIVFGPKWAYAAPLVAIMCVSAVARPLADAASQLLRAIGRTGWELGASLAMTTVYLGAFALALPDGLTIAVGVLAATAMLLQLGFAVAVRLVADRADRPAAAGMAARGAIATVHVTARSEP